MHPCRERLFRRWCIFRGQRGIWQQSTICSIRKKLAEAFEECHEKCEYPDKILNNPVAYEDPEESINIAIDDVIVKRQEDIRKGGEERRNEESVSTFIIRLFM